MDKQFIEMFGKGEPILKSEVPVIYRSELEVLVASGELCEYSKGIYYVPYTTSLGTAGEISAEKLIEKLYVRCKGLSGGYEVGLTLANKYGFTTQCPAVTEVCSNRASEDCEVLVAGRRVIVYKPAVYVTNQNVDALQWNALLEAADKYSELSSGETATRLKKLKVHFITK